MESLKRLFFIALLAIFSASLLAGCASVSPAPVEEARMSPATGTERDTTRAASAQSGAAAAVTQATPVDSPKRTASPAATNNAAANRSTRMASRSTANGEGSKSAPANVSYGASGRANGGASIHKNTSAINNGNNNDPAAGERSPEMLFAALAAAGFDYQRGGKSMSTGFDCSGLVAHVFREAYGVQLPHNAAAQSERGREVSRDELEPGDLVFFNTERRRFSHVGIYLGDNRFIHAPKPGAVVRTENMQVAYWRTRFDGARRIIE